MVKSLQLSSVNKFQWNWQHVIKQWQGTWIPATHTSKLVLTHAMPCCLKLTLQQYCVPNRCNVLLFVLDDTNVASCFMTYSVFMGKLKSYIYDQYQSVITAMLFVCLNLFRPMMPQETCGTGCTSFPSSLLAPSSCLTLCLEYCQGEYRLSPVSW